MIGLARPSSAPPYSLPSFAAPGSAHPSLPVSRTCICKSVSTPAARDTRLYMCSLAWIVAFPDCDFLGDSHTLNQPFATRLDVPRPFSTQDQLPTDIDQGVIQGTVGHLCLGEALAEQETNIRGQTTAQAHRPHVQRQIYKEHRLRLLSLLKHPHPHPHQHPRPHQRRHQPHAYLLDLPAIYLLATLFAHIATAATAATTTTASHRTFFEHHPRFITHHVHQLHVPLQQVRPRHRGDGPLRRVRSHGGILPGWRPARRQRLPRWILRQPLRQSTPDAD